MNIKQIPLTEDKVAIVDNKDYLALSKYKWHFSHGYAKRMGKENGRNKAIYMHRVIFGIAQGKDIDHINGDRLDNRKSNLRLATDSQNQANSRIRVDNTSGYKGVAKCTNKKKWFAQIQVNKKQIFLGRFSDIKDAVLAYNDAAIFYFGKYARIK